MKLITTDTYERKAKKFFKKHPELIDKYKNTLSLLIENSEQSSLKLHKLKGNLKDFYSISLSFEFRIILLIELSKEAIYLVDIGTHDEVY